MREIAELFRRFKVLSGAFLVFIVVYIWHTVTSTPDRVALRKYHISGTQLHELALAIVIPYIVIWLIGLVGYMWLQNYTNALGKSKDGAAFRTISRGVFLLVLWLPISVICSGLAARYYGVHHDATAWLIRTINYLNIIMLWPAFYLLYRGSKGLVAVARVKAQGLTQRQAMLFVVFTAFYVFVALSDSVRQSAHGLTSVATYYLPDWLTVLTVLVPRLLTWYIGLSAVSNIFLYRQKVKGTIYQAALRSFAIGIGVVIFGITLLRVVQSLSAVLGGWRLSVFITLIYFLLFVLGLGYFLVARGAKRLLKIEQS